MINKILEKLPRQFFLISFFLAVLFALLTFLWFFTEQDFESGAGFVASIGALITAFVFERIKSQQQAKFYAPELPPILVGRKVEITNISNYLNNRKNTAKVAIVGMPGKGKTTLAIQVVHRIRRKFSDGIFWLQVTELTVVEILREIIVFFGDSSLVSFEKKEIGVARASELLFNKKALIILDDVPEKLVEELLHILKLPCAILVTSQYKELPLIPREGIFDPSNTLSKDAWVSLLSMRLAEARYARRYSVIETSWTSYIIHKFWLWWIKLVGFLTESKLTNQSAIKAIFQEVEGLPLALDIVASSISFESAEDLSKYLHDLRRAKLSELSESPTPYLNVRATLRVAYERLSGIDRQLFALLSMRHGAEIPLSFVEALWGMSEMNTKRALQHFVWRSLIELGIPGQWYFHTLIREFAKEQLEVFGDEKKEAGGRLASYYAEWAQVHAGQSFNLWEREWPDLRFAIDWAVFMGKDEATVNLALLTSTYLEFKKLWRTKYKWLKLGIASARNLQHLQQQDIFGSRRFQHITLSERLGGLCLQIGTYKEAKEYLNEAIELSKQSNKDLSARLHCQLGRANARLGLYQIAKSNYEEARVQYQIKGEWTKLAQLTILISQLLMSQRQYDDAYALFKTEELLRFQRKIGRGFLWTFLILQNGYAATKTGKFEEARLRYDEALQEFKLFGSISGVARTLSCIGQMHFDKGDYVKATQHYTWSLQHYRQVKEVPGLYGTAETLERLGDVACKTECFIAASKLYQRALIRYQMLSFRPGQVHILTKLGKIAMVNEEFLDASDFFQDAVEKYQEWKIEEPWCLAEAAYWAAFISELLCNYPQSASYYQLALKTYRSQLGDVSSEVKIQACLARLAILQGKYMEAKGRLEGASTLSLGEIIDPLDRLPIAMELGNLALTARDFEEAKLQYSQLLGYDSAEKKYLKLQAKALVKLTDVALFESDVELALSYAKQASSKYKVLGKNKIDSVEEKISLGKIALKQMHYDEAGQNFREALVGTEQLGFCLQKIEALCGIAEVLRSSDDFSSSINSLKQALNLTEEVGLIFMQAMILSKIGKVEFMQDNLEQAKSWTNKSLHIFETLELAELQIENNLQLAEIALASNGYSEIKKCWSRAIEIADESERDRVYARFRDLVIAQDDYEWAYSYAREALDSNREKLWAELDFLRSAMGEERYQKWEQIYIHQHGST
ncbi:MAG: hypothetical protein H6657_14680 [Ardenticatenaceae bacterium]|nr:hypothetical protein [Ardenticatenaceae bacterium]